MKEVRQSGNFSFEDRHVSGYALVFETPSDNLSWIETIKQGAITEETIQNSDVLARLNHEDSKVLARCRYGTGSMILTLDSKGLKYEFDAPNTALGDELIEYLKRGDITSSSFCFSISQEPGAEKWYKRDGVIYRDIYKIDRLFDVAPCFIPAYEAASCSKRFSEVEATSKEIDEQMNKIKLEIDLL